MTDEVRTDSLDRPDATHRAAGILFRAPEQTGLFLKRGPGGDYPGFWCFPGGHFEPEDGSLEATACREANEEIGSLPKGKREPLARSITIQQLPEASATGAAIGAANAVHALAPTVAPDAPSIVAPKVVDFSTFLQDVDDQFPVVKDGEHTGFAWSPLNDPPQPLHPGCAIALKRLYADELGVARMMAAGELTSPQRYRNVTLWAMRITGTGVAYRRPVLDAKGNILREEEFPWRDPGLYLNDEFLARCNGLPVIGGHPKKDVLDSKEFGRRIVGTIFLPYISGEEVWGIAKVWDDESNDELSAGKFSTSPAVVLADPANPSYKFRLESGELLLVEGKPSLLDHLAICERGVWDKGGDPAGIINETMETEEMSVKEEIKADAVEPSMADVMAALGGIAQSVTSIGARVDAMEDNFKAKSDADEDEKKSDEDKDEKKSDAEEDDKKSDEDKDEKKSDAEEDDKDEKKSDAAMEVAADACAKADSALAMNKNILAQITKLAGRIPVERNEDDHRGMSAAQARADSVYELFGKQAPRFLAGETNRAYRNRLVRDFQEHSVSWRPVDLATLADDAFRIAEEAVYADAAVAAKSAIGVEDGGLRMVPGRTASGHQTVEFHGRPSAWLGRFGGSRRFAKSIRPNTSREVN